MAHHDKTIPSPYFKGGKEGVPYLKGKRVIRVQQGSRGGIWKESNTVGKKYSPEEKV